MPVLIPKSFEVRLTAEECEAGVSAGGLCFQVENLWQSYPVETPVEAPNHSKISNSCPGPEGNPQEILESSPAVEEEIEAKDEGGPEAPLRCASGSLFDDEPFELCFKCPGVVNVMDGVKLVRSVSLPHRVLWSLFDSLDAAGEDGLSVTHLIRSVKGWDPEKTTDSAVKSSVCRLNKFLRRHHLGRRIECVERAEKNNSKKIFYVLVRGSP